MTRVICLFLCAAACARDGVASSAPCPTDAISTSGGCVRGTPEGQVVAYRGIPYAAPPTGDHRWAPPAPPAPWHGVRDAGEFGKACPQLTDTTIGGKLDTDEDCLSLNVWAAPGSRAKPVTPDIGTELAGRPRPVMVWIHGGGLVQGGSALPFYDGAQLATTGDVVVVSLNYRLGPLGFLSHPAFGAHSGNYGLLDQIAALRWVADNIDAFGGDPKSVTIFGESAGGESVCALMASPLATGLYERAVIESAQCAGDQAVPALHDGEAQGSRIAGLLGCDGPDAARCLRGKSVDEVLHASPARLGFLGKGERYGLVRDGHALIDSPGALLDAGRLARVPVLVGTNGDEGALFAAIAGLQQLTREAYVAELARLFPGMAMRVLAQYAPRTFGSPLKAFDALLTDDVFACPTRHAARQLAALGPVFRYLFSRGTAIHGAEVPYVFGTMKSPSDADRALSTAMMAYWARFAHTGDPGGAWPAYAASSDRTLVLDTGIHVIDGVDTAGCDLLDSLSHAR
jgi:para-nitrobenzyl esterase